MAAIFQNGGHELQILHTNSTLSYVLDAKHKEVTIFIDYYAHGLYLLDIWLKNAFTVAYEGHNWRFIIAICITGAGAYPYLLYYHTWVLSSYLTAINCFRDKNNFKK